jgi:AAA+ ATPase superfamily predicted ATPase
MKDSPAFPTYQGPPLPKTLNPLAPLRYLMLLKWMHFQPSRLKHYLWQAGPELYNAQGLKGLSASLQNPAYQDLYLTSAVLVMVLSAGLAWITPAARGILTDWKGVVFGALAGITFGLLFAVVGGVAFGAGFGAMFGPTFGVVFGGTFGLVFGVVYGLMGGTWFGLAGGLAFGVAFGIAFIMAFGMTFGLAGGFGFIVALVAVLAGTLGVAFVLVGSQAVLLALVVAGVVAIVAGASRLLPNILQWWQALFLSHSRNSPCLSLAHHPVLWDEYILWPLPGTYRLLRACLEADLDCGLHLVSQVAANPFQRWAVQRALSDFVASQKGRLGVIYRLVHSPALGQYLTIPTRRVQFQSFPSARLVLLGEIGQQRVAASSEATESTEYLIWRVTHHQRRIKPTPFSQFCALLYGLLRDEAKLETTDVEQIKLAERFASAYEGVRPFGHGVEVAESFGTIDSFLCVDTIEAIATAHQLLGWADDLAVPLLRPAVIEALRALGDVSREVSVYVQATSTGLKSAALNRAIGALGELSGYVQKNVQPPEGGLLDRVVTLWQSVIAAEQGRLGEAALHEMAPTARRAAGIVERTSSVWQRPSRPFDNPYIVGDPVYPPLLVGRKDVFDRIGEVWTAKRNPDSIILYGHRRMGKSSILRNLDQAAPQGSIVVYADLAGETSFIESTSDLLLGLADRIYHAARRAYPAAPLPKPDPREYSTQAQAQFQLNRLLEGVRDALVGGSLILALDEFEAVERAVENQKVGKEIYQFLRAKTQEPWLTLVFGGLHTLDEMSRDYQQPFYGSYENISVSYLAPKDAWRLITNPTDDFVLNYEPAAVERIVAETGGQPYLVQQICRDALDHLNHDLFDSELKRKVCITLADVAAVLEDDLFRRGTVYFDGVWTQASDHTQQMLLRAVASCDELCTLSELQAVSGMDEHALLRQLGWADRHDILYKTDLDRWAFHVPLMQRWIRNRFQL